MTLAVVAISPFAASCGEDGSSSGTRTTGSSRAAKEPDASHLQLVALGDSETTGSGDSAGLGWVERYARLLRTKRDLKVDVSNLARNGTKSAELLSSLRGDANTRGEVKRAQVVLLGIGGADIEDADANTEAGRCRVQTCYAAMLKSFASNSDAIVAEVRKLRGSNKTVVRAITHPNVLTGAEDVSPPFLRPVATRIGVYEASTATRAICDTMTKYDGRCVDLLRAINGPNGRADGYKKGLLNHEECCYPSAKGQQLMAELLFKTRLAPVR
ncbi:MAG: SGNH/GDSL hydrolase family protein [Thermoleophilaceae bacterium]